MTGGNIQYDPFLGPPWTTLYDPATNQFYQVENMAHGRWYPSNAALSDGGTMVFGGLDAQGNTNTNVEIYDVGAGWSPEYPSNFTPGWYPRLHLLGNGKVFMSGPNPDSHTFSPTTGTWAQQAVATTNYGQSRLYGSSVLLPLDPNTGYRPQVVIFGGNTQGATNTVEYIDLGQSVENWVYMPPMSVPRVTMNAVLLPNGKILTLGGSTSFNDASTAHLNAETFDPVAQTWTPSGSEAYARMYHSSALLLPDGTVWVAGSNPTRDWWEPHMEIYKPPYLFTSTGAAAARPAISTVPAVVGYGQTFTVGTSTNANSISKVVLMRPGSNTHAFDSEQRLLYTYFSATSASALSVTSPTSQGAAPPGWYMVFIIDGNGVPSVAKFLQLMPNPTNQPPTATITNPTTSSVTIAAGQTVTFAGSASDPDGSIFQYQWNFPGGTPSKKVAQGSNPGTATVTYATPGLYTASLTVVDNVGANNPSPPTVTVNVTGGALKAAITSPTYSGTVSGTVTVTMTASNAQGSPTNFLLKQDNVTTLSNQSVAGSSATYAWNTINVPDGLHTLNLTVTDGAGRTATDPVQVTVANGTGGGGGGGGGGSCLSGCGATSMTVAITAPANNTWTGNSIHMTASASSTGAPLASLKIYGAGGVALQKTCAGTSCSLDDWWTTGPLADGAYQTQAVSQDTAGNITVSSVVTIIKNQTAPVIASGAPNPSADTTAPTVSITSPASGATVSGSTTVSANAADNVGVAGVQFKLDGANLGTEATAAPYFVPWDTTTATNGTHTLTAVARDAAGNTKTSAAVTVTVSNTGDTTAPTVSITAPAGGATVSGATVAVSATAADNVGVAGVQFKLDGANLGIEDTTAPYSITWDSTTAADGTHTLTAVARDAAGNTTTSAPVTVTVANGCTSNCGSSSIAATITAPPNNSWTGNSIHVTATASSTGAALTSLKIYGNGGVALQTTCTGTSCPLDDWWNTAPLAAGAYQIQAVATDTTGACAVSAPVTIIKDSTTPVTLSGAPTCSGGGTPPDTTPPAVSMTAPAGGATVVGSVTVSATASDNVGVAGVQFKLDGANLGAEDTTSPYSMTWDSTTTTNGSHTLTAVARDAAGNTTTSAAVTVTVNNPGPADTTPPTVSITAPASGSTLVGSVTITATASDNVGVAGVQFKLDGANLGLEDTTSPYSLTWDTTSAANGSHTLTATARDAAGNTTTSAPVTVTVNNPPPADTTPPTVSITAPANGATVTGSVTVTAMASDNVGVLGVQFKLDGANLGAEDTTSPYSITWDATTATQGTHTLTAVARDAAGNTTTSAPITVTVANGTPPTVSISTPHNGDWIGNSVHIVATASSTGPALTSLKIYGNGGVVLQVACSGTTCALDDWWTTTALPDAAYQIQAVATNALGQSTISTPPITLNKNQTSPVIASGASSDTVSPTVTITAPENGGTVSGGITITATASDNVGVVGVQFKVDGVNVGAEDTVSPYSATWDTTGATNGSHTVSAVARDAAGNVATSSVSVTVNNVCPPGGCSTDTTPPAVSISTPHTGDWTGNSIRVTATATDNAGVSTLKLYGDGVQFGATVICNGAASCTFDDWWSTGALASGQHTIVAVATDTSGNQTSSTPVTINK
jgi:hypothetical protein